MNFISTPMVTGPLGTTFCTSSKYLEEFISGLKWVSTLMENYNSILMVS
ncbi:hypothetical protein KGM_209436 [Danaus plexippus plexippus]|uniref:Uncharacterized protein n=1 Tax=Danaus plexippus plexippus TaxID=278856 RepID=A0A212FNK5_DANPL|nr:hypothetical protein KGM_209436 [Danaus plexippus plexippus]